MAGDDEETTRSRSGPSRTTSTSTARRTRRGRREPRDIREQNDSEDRQVQRRINMGEWACGRSPTHDDNRGRLMLDRLWRTAY